MNEKVENNLMVNWYYTGIDLQYSLTSFLACASVNASFRALGAWFQILAVFPSFLLVLLFCGFYLDSKFMLALKLSKLSDVDTGSLFKFFDIRKLFQSIR